jgi:hypothetical protein
VSAILWRRLDRPGHESARLRKARSGWTLEGRSAFADERGPCGLAYRVLCGPDWRTRSVQVTGWVGSRPVRFSARVDASGAWHVQGSPAPALAGCLDVDLNFSPATNLLPIRRLAPAPGEEREVRAAWVRFPDFQVEPLEQRYLRVSDVLYRYRSDGGRFERELTVRADGFVTRYPDFFELDG